MLVATGFVETRWTDRRLVKEAFARETSVWENGVCWSATRRLTLLYAIFDSLYCPIASGPKLQGKAIPYTMHRERGRLDHERDKLLSRVTCPNESSKLNG